MDISFTCTACGQSLSIDPSGIGMTVECPSCQQQLIVPKKTSSVVATTLISPPMPPVEKEFMNNAGVRITNTRAIISGTTYAMANITSVRASTTPAKRGGAINCIILGAILLLIGLAASTLACDVLGIILIAIGILVLRSKKDIHTVMIGTAGGEVDAVSSTNRNYIVSIVAAMNNAITHRG